MKRSSADSLRSHLHRMAISAGVPLNVILPAARASVRGRRGSVWRAKRVVPRLARRRRWRDAGVAPRSSAPLGEVGVAHADGSDDASEHPSDRLFW